MSKHRGLQIQLSRGNRKQIEELLSGGVQPVRTVIRALVLRQMDEGRTTVEAGGAVGISAKAAWEIGKRYLEGGLERAIYMRHVRVRSRCWTPSMGSASSPWFAGHRPQGGHAGQCG
jgi:hypothetical protein